MNLTKLVNCKCSLMSWEAIFDLVATQAAVVDLEKQMEDPSIYANRVKAQELGKKLKTHRSLLQNHSKIKGKLEDIFTLIEMGKEMDDETVGEEIKSELQITEEELTDFTLKQTLSGEHDLGNCFLTIHPGAGGTESCDWAQMLMRMYVRWIEQQGYAYDTIDLQPGSEAGINNATIHVKGDYAFGYMKAEKGIHRLVRISPFDSNSRRHTSFTAVFVMPEIDESIDIDIEEKDLRIDTYRSSGAGGQHVNVTDSAVRITHLPTGLVVSCQNERSQHKNKATGMKVLKSRLYEYYLKEQEKKIEELAGEKQEIAWGNQIRSYVFHPYNMVKDHRTNEETGNIQAVMDGQINNFMKAYLSQNMKG